MYEPPADERPGCRETLVLTRVTFAVLLPVLGAMLLVMSAAVAVIVLFIIQPALALIPLGLLVAAIFAFARWDRRRTRPPGP